MDSVPGCQDYDLSQKQPFNELSRPDAFSVQFCGRCTDLCHQHNQNTETFYHPKHPFLLATPRTKKNGHPLPFPPCSQ